MPAIHSRLRKVAKLVVLTILAAQLPACSNCTDTIFAEKKAPDNKHVAAIFERNCGATTGNNRQISIRRTGDRFDSKKQPPFFVTEDFKGLDISWKDSKTLVVSNRVSERIFRQLSESIGIRIEYLAPDD